MSDAKGEKVLTHGEKNVAVSRSTRLAVVASSTAAKASQDRVTDFERATVGARNMFDGAGTFMTIDSWQEVRRCIITRMEVGMTVKVAKSIDPGSVAGKSLQRYEDAVRVDLPNASVMKAHNDLVRLELSKVELNVYKLERSMRLFNDEGFGGELLRHLALVTAGDCLGKDL